MKEPRLEPDSPAHGVISYDARIAADTDVSASSYASTVSTAPLETLEVHDQPAKAQVVAPMTDNRFKAPFSRRKAAVVSSIITVLVILLTVVTLAILSREAKQPNASSRLNISSQDIQLKNQSNATAPAELQGAGSAVLINGDLITRGQLKVTNGAYITVLRSANLTSSRSLTLPNASGTLCVDSNNCGYATSTQLQDLQARLGQIVIPAIPDTTTVNGLSGAMSIQGTSNQISVTTANGVIALSTPQDIAPISSPTFAGLVLNGNFSLSGTVTLPLNCSGMLNGGALTTNASGQIICSGDDSASGGGGSAVTTAGGTAGNLALFTAADTIADSIISQALGAITISGNTTVSGALSANSLTLATALSVANGGTGATTFTTNGVLLGNGTGAVSSTTAPAAGQVLLGNASNVPEFTTISGDVAITAAGVTAIQANSIALGVDTTGNYVANLGTLTGLTASGNTGEGSTPTLSVVYGSTANTSVQGNTSISVTAGTNLTGGGSITLGSGGTVTLNVTNSPTFSGNIIAQGGAVTIGNTAGAIGSVVLHDGNGQIGSLTTTDLAAGRTYTFPDATGTVCLSTGNCVGGTGGAPNAATFLTIGNNATLTNERSITAGSNISFTDGGANGTFTIDTVNNPNFSTSVTTPLLQSSGALSITPSGALTVGATGQTALLQGSTTTITSNGAGNDIVLTSADQITLTGFNCTTFANGGALTTDASGNIVCANDDGGAGGAITGAGTANRLTLFTGSQSVADSWLLQNGSTLELDNTRNLSLLGGNFSVTGTGTFSGLLTANGSLTIESGDTFTMNGDAFTDLTGTGLVISSGSLQTTLGTSVDLAAEVSGILPVANGGTGVNGSTAANGQLLIGNGTGYTLATLTQGDGITITNAAGGITVASSFGTSIDLGVETTGNYQAGTTAGNGIAVSGTPSGGWSPTIALGALTSNWNQTGAFDIVLNNANSQLKVLESAGGTYFGSIDVGDLTADRTYTFPDASGTICLSTGNCAGAGGGITGSGTSDTIAKFTGTGTIGDSSISDDGSVVTINGTANLVIQGGTATFGTTTQAGTLTISDGSSNTVSIVMSAFGADRQYTIPDVGADATFCLSTGNCVGGGGGGAPNAAAYLVASLDGTLTNERALNAGSNISLTDGGAGGNFTVATVQNPTFTTSVTTPQLQSSGALTLVSAAGEVIAVDAGTTIELQDSTNVTGSLDVSVALNVGTSNTFQVNSSGAIAAATGITSSGNVTFSALNCTTFTNGGKVTTNVSGQLTCANDNGAAANTITGTGTNGTLPMFTATNVIADSIVTQSGTTVNIAGDLTLSTDLAVAQGGTGASSFTSNGVLYGNNTGALQVTAAGTSGQVLVANASGVPTFVSFSGDVTVAADGTTTIQANSVALGTDTTGNYIRNLGTLTGLSTTGNTGEAATPTLSVDYGSTANTAVQGNTQLTCASGTGNLSGGGTVITLGAGGTCGALNTVANPTFSTSVTTPSLQSTGALAIQTGGGANNIVLGSSDTTGTLLVLDIKTDAGDPTGVNGGMYYNSSLGKFRCYQNGAWTDCIPVASTVTLQTAYTASTNPEITVDSTRGALTVRDNATPIAANLFEVQNNAGTTTYLAISATGASITGNLNVAGTGASGDVALTVRGNGAQGGGDLIADFQSYDGVTTKSILRVTNDAGLFIGNNTGTAARFGISNGTYYGTLQTTNLTSSHTYELPNVDGTICTDAGNCGSTTGTLQSAYNYSVGGTTPEIKLNNPQTAIDIQDADTTLGSGANFMSLRASNASGLGTLLVGFGIQGNLYMRPSADRTDLVDINDTNNNNLFTVDSTNKRVGINLGGSALPSYTLDVSGSANVSNYLLVPTIDTESAVALNVGSTNATSINLNQNTSVANNKSFTANGVATFKSATNSTSAFQVQSASAADTLFAVDTTARSASGGNLIKIGNSTGTDGDLTILQVDSATANPTSNLAALNGGLFYNSTTHKLSIIENGQIKVICNTTDLGCGTGTVTLQSAYNNSTNPEIVLGSASTAGLTVRDNATPISGSLLEVQSNDGAFTYLGVTANGIGVTGIATVSTAVRTPTLDTASAVALNIGTTNATAINLNQNTTIASNKTFTANGTALFQSATNSSTAFQIQNASGAQILNVNTTTDSTNLIDGAGVCGATPTCGGFESGTGNWQLVNSSGNAAMTTTTSQYVFGTRSMDATFGSTSDKIKLPITLSNNSYYTLNFYARSDLAASAVLSAGYSQNGSTEDVAALSISSQSVSNTGWTHYLVSIATGTVSGSPYIYLKQNSGTIRHIYIDNIKLAQVTSTTQQAVPHYSPAAIALGAPISTPLIVAPSDNSTALQVLSEDGTSVFSVDTKNRYVGIGTMSPSSKLQVVAGGTSGIAGFSVIRGGASVLDSTTGGSANLNLLTLYNTQLMSGADLFKVTNGGGVVIASATGADSSSGNARDGVAALQATSGNGGNGTGAGGGGGWGGAIDLTAGNGGTSAIYYGGWGGSVGITAGNGGDSSNSSGGYAGGGGNIVLTAGNGGGGALANGGGAGAITLQAGTGGPFLSGGDVNIRSGAAGTFGPGYGSIKLFAGNGSVIATGGTATAFQVLDYNNSNAPLLTVDASSRSASGGNLIKVGNSTGTDGALTILQLDAATANPTSNLSALNGGLFYNSTTNKVSLVENGQVKIICNTTDLGCGTGTVTLQSAYDNSTNPEITLDATRGALTIQDNASPISGNLLEVKSSNGTSTYFGLTSAALTLGTNVDLLMQGVSAYISNPQGQTDSEAFGLNATVGNTGGVAVGNSASAGINAVSMGYSTDAQGNAVAIGYNAFANSSGISIGRDAQASTNSIAIGRDAVTTASNQLVIGSENSTQFINHVVIGDGVTSATPNGFTLQGTSGSGSNIAGASVNIAAGQGTGSADGGTINLQTSAVGGAGSGLNALTTVASFSSTAINLNQDTTIASGKRLGVGAATESSAIKLQVWLNTANDIVALNSGTSGSTASGIWGQNIGFLSQNSEAQIVSAGSVPLVFKTNGSRNSMAGSPVEQMRIAPGVVTLANGVILQSANGSGTNVAGSNLNIAGGQGTGTAAGGSINLQVSAAGTSGSSLNSLATVATFNSTTATIGSTATTTAINLQSAGTTLVTSTSTSAPALKVQQVASSAAGGHGLLVMGGTSPGEAAFEVRNSGNTAVFSVDTSNSRTTVGSGATCTGRLCVGQSSSGAAGGATTTNLYNIQNINISSGTPTYIGQSIVLNDTSTAQTTTLRPLVIDTTGSTNTSAQVNAIQVQGRSGAAGTFIQLQNGATDVLNINNTGATTFRMVSGSDSATAFRIQDGSAASLFTVDTTTRSASGGNLIKIGNSTGTDTDLTILKLDAATADPTSNLSALSGGLYYNSTTNKVQIIENGVVKELCNKVDTGCGAAGPSLGKNLAVNETSTSNFAGTMYTFTQQNTGAAGVLSLANAGTSSTLRVTSTGNASTNNALLFGQLTNASISGNLLDLRSGTSGSETSKFTVAASGATNIQGTVTIQSQNSGAIGAAGADALTIQAANGGNTTTIVNGGNGGGMSFTSGNGGDATNISADGGNGGDIVFTLGSGGNGGNFPGSVGAVIIRPASTGTITSGVVLRVQDSGSNNLLSVDTNMREIQVGSYTADGTMAALVVDSTNASYNEVASKNGAIYYNNGGKGGAANSAYGGKFRCHEGNVWKNCIGMRDIVERRWGYVAPAGTGATSLTGFGNAPTPAAGSGPFASGQTESYYIGYSTNGVALNSNGIFPNNASTQGRYLPKLSTRIRIDAATNVRHWVALTSINLSATNPVTTSTGSAGAAYMGVGASTSFATAPGVWICGAADGTNKSGTSTGVSIVSGNYYDIVLEISGSSLICSISTNGGAFVSTMHSSNVPTSSSTNMGMQASTTALDTALINMRIAYMYQETN